MGLPWDFLCPMLILNKRCGSVLYTYYYYHYYSCWCCSSSSTLPCWHSMGSFDHFLWQEECCCRMAPTAMYLLYLLLWASCSYYINGWMEAHYYYVGMSPEVYRHVISCGWFFSSMKCNNYYVRKGRGSHDSLSWAIVGSIIDHSIIIFINFLSR